MQASSIRLSLLSIVLSAAAIPALAGNYSQGDPRPVAFTSTASPAAVAAETRAWMAIAPTGGYPQGEHRTLAPVNQQSRAVVQADTKNWIASGLSTVQYSQAGADRARPAYVQAAEAYVDLRDASQATRTSQAPTAPTTMVR
jgi:hypothetical protein